MFRFYLIVNRGHVTESFLFQTSYKTAKYIEITQFCISLLVTSCLQPLEVVIETESERYRWEDQCDQERLNSIPKPQFGLPRVLTPHFVWPLMEERTQIRAVSLFLGNLLPLYFNVQIPPNFFLFKADSRLRIQ